MTTAKANRDPGATLRRQPAPAGALTPSTRALAGALALVGAAACSDDVGLPDARPPVDAPVPGQLMVAWTISHDGTTLTCADVAATSVTIELIPVGAVFGVVDSLGCTSGVGVTRDLAPGAYDVRFSLGGSGGVLAGPISRLAVTVTSGQVTTLDPVAFDVDPSGTLQFHVVTAAGDNCAAMPGGAGITSVELQLRDGGGACVPTTFAIAAGGGQPAGTYDSDCAGAVYPACIAATQTVTAAGVRSGQRSMVLVGRVGADACWRRTSSFIVRAARQTTALNPQELLRDVQLCPP